MDLRNVHYDGEIVIKKIEVGTLENNAYFVIDPDSKEALLIDAAWEPDRLLAETEGLKVLKILTTHGHRDHWQAFDPVRASLKVPGGIGEIDRDMLPTPPDFTIKDGDEFQFGTHKLKAMFTPGHTPGGTCFLFGQHLFSGDTLFPGGPGNTKSAIGNFPQIIESIRTRLFTLPEDTVVYPGHGLDTTIGKEKPHLQEWIDRGW
jgi:glyoxylase-like metal-dependent hydrolase (beta-lactamase superfamily II)